MNFIRTPHKAFLLFIRYYLKSSGICKASSQQKQAFQGHEQTQNDDAWRQTLKSLLNIQKFIIY